MHSFNGPGSFTIVPVKSDYGKITYKVKVNRSTGKAVSCDCQAQTACKHLERAELIPAFLNARDAFEAAGVNRAEFNAKFTASVEDFKAANPKYKHRLSVNHAIKRVIAAAPAPKCQKCGGSGHLPEYNHIQRGVRFPCKGNGVVFH